MRELTLWQRLRLAWAEYWGTDIVLRASNGVDVRVHQSFARAYWQAPDLWQESLDAGSIRWED